MNGFKCNNLTKKMDKFVLRNVSFEIEPGMVLGLVGVNGSGKTTLIHTLLGAGSHRLTDSMDEGEFSIYGYHFMRDVKEYKKRIAYILSEPPFISSMYPEELGELYGYYYDTFDLDKYRKLLDNYSIPQNNYLEKLSTGQLLKLQLAFALSYDAALYVMDEPTGNLDVDFRDEFYEIIRGLSADGKMILLSSHMITELETVADKVLWITRQDYESNVFFNGTLDELLEEYRMVEADRELLAKLPEKYVVGSKLADSHSEALVKYGNEEEDENNILSFSKEEGVNVRYADLSEIMYYVEKNKGAAVEEKIL